MVDDDRFLYLISPESVTTPEALDAFAGKLEEALATGHVAAFQLRLKNVPSKMCAYRDSNPSPQLSSPWMRGSRADVMPEALEG